MWVPNMKALNRGFVNIAYSFDYAGVEVVLKMYRMSEEHYWWVALKMVVVVRSSH